MSGDLKIDEHQVRAISARELESYISSKQIILDEHSASFRWLMASLLAINAGGLLKCADVAGLISLWTFVATGSFLVGILAALAIAWLGQRANRKMLEPLGKLIGFWTVANATACFDEEQHSQLIGEVQTAVNSAGGTRCVGWVATLAFVLGVVSLLLGSGMQARQLNGVANSRVQLQLHDAQSSPLPERSGTTLPSNPQPGMIQP